MLVQSLNLLLTELAHGAGWRWGAIVGLSERRRLFHRALLEGLTLPEAEITEAWSETWALLAEPALARQLAAHCNLIYGDAAMADRLVANAQALVATFQLARAVATGDVARAGQWTPVAAARLDPEGELDDLSAAWSGGGFAELFESLLPADVLPASRRWVEWWVEQAGWHQPPDHPTCTLPVAGYQERLGGLLFDLWLQPVAGPGRLIEHPEMALMPVNDDLVATLEGARQRLDQGLFWRLIPRGLTEVEVLRGCSLSGAAHVGCQALRDGRRLDPGCLVVASVDGGRLARTEHEQAKLDAAAADRAVTRIVLPPAGTSSGAIVVGARADQVISRCTTVLEAAGLAATRPPVRAPASRVRRGAAYAAQLALVAVAIALLPRWSTRETESAVQPLYALTDLGTLGGPTSSASDLNDRDEVVGSSDNGRFEEAFRWRPETGLVGLGTITGFSIATGINRSGWVCGYSGADHFHLEAVVWDPDGRMRRLGNLGLGEYSSAHGINDAGRVAGRANHAIYAEAFVWDPRRGMTGLGAGLNYTSAAKINNRGVVAANTSPTSFQDWQPRRWDRRHGLQPLPDLGGGDTSTLAINNRGQAGGVSHNGQRREAVLWLRDGSILRLGTLYWRDSQVEDVNDAGQAVGSIGGVRGFVWSRAAGMHDVNRLLRPEDAGYQVITATAINRHGHIAGTAIDQQGRRRAVLLTPLDDGVDERSARQTAQAQGLASKTDELRDWTVCALGDAQFGPAAEDQYDAVVVRFATADDQIDHLVVPLGERLTVHGRRLSALLFDEEAVDNPGEAVVVVLAEGRLPLRRSLPGTEVMTVAEARGADFRAETDELCEWRVTVSGSAWFDAWWRRPYRSAVVQYQTAEGHRSYAVAPVGVETVIEGRTLRVLLADDGPKTGRGRLTVAVRATEAGGEAITKVIESRVPEQEPERS